MYAIIDNRDKRRPKIIKIALSKDEAVTRGMIEETRDSFFPSDAEDVGLYKEAMRVLGKKKYLTLGVTIIQEL